MKGPWRSSIQQFLNHIHHPGGGEQPETSLLTVPTFDKWKSPPWEKNLSKVKSLYFINLFPTLLQKGSKVASKDR